MAKNWQRVRAKLSIDARTLNSSVSHLSNPVNLYQYFALFYVF